MDYATRWVSLILVNSHLKKNCNEYTTLKVESHTTSSKMTQFDRQ